MTLICEDNEIIAVMGGATPHGGVEPSGAQNGCVGFPRVVVECLLALAELAEERLPRLKE